MRHAPCAPFQSSIWASSYRVCCVALPLGRSSLSPQLTAEGADAALTALLDAVMASGPTTFEAAGQRGG